MISFVLVWIGTKCFLPVLHKLNFGQAIRKEGPKSHQKKSGTPTMGGIVIQGGILIAMVVFTFIVGKDLLFPLLGMIAFGVIGFIDDYIKVTAHHNLGLRAWQKLVLQIAVALVIAIYAGQNPEIGTQLVIPFSRRLIDLGWGFYPFTIFVVVAVTNAVNLTDGLDGLCSGVTGFVMIFFMTVAIVIKNPEIAAFSGAVVGGCFGFLRWNSNPADIFMGDTGSLALGGAVVTTAIAMRLQIFILIAGFIYFLEALSVIMQVTYFKATHGKRIFKMTPIHHHFELSGWSEPRVVTVFWILTVIFVSIAMLAIF
ncbi:MAG: phospho-N-acetylmuramoyl-pentapeptide-transferase [Pseudoramibacter sp.]